MKRAFISHAQEDAALCDALAVHLEVLRGAGILDIWHARKIAPGGDRALAIDSQLHHADIVIFLVSAHFFACQACQEREFGPALTRWKEGRTLVLPIIVRACDWTPTPIGQMQVLPAQGRPVSTWPHPDDAWTEVVREVRALATHHMNAGHHEEQAQPRASDDPPTGETKQRGRSTAIIGGVDEAMIKSVQGSLVKHVVHSQTLARMSRASFLPANEVTRAPHDGTPLDTSIERAQLFLQLTTLGTKLNIALDLRASAAECLRELLTEFALLSTDGRLQYSLIHDGFPLELAPSLEAQGVRAGDVLQIGCALHFLE